MSKKKIYIYCKSDGLNFIGHKSHRYCTVEITQNFSVKSDPQSLSLQIPQAKKETIYMFTWLKISGENRAWQRISVGKEPEDRLDEDR